MPKRILDGDAIWTSKKIAALEPAWVRPEYTWVHSLAGPNGVFEFDLRAIWARCYAFLRPEIGLPEVEIIFAAFQKTKLVFLWEQDGKQWAYWTNSDKPGRLPRKSWQKRYAEKGTLGPYPPEDALKKFMQEAAARPSRASNTPEPCKPHASSVQGIGSGTRIGSGLGKDSSSEGKAPSDVVNQLPAEDPDKKARLGAAKQLAELLALRILENNSESELKHERVRKRRIVSWTTELERMIRLDGWSEEKIQELIEFSQRDSFWYSNILSAVKLRKQRDQLRLKMQPQRDRQQGGDLPKKNAVDDLGRPLTKRGKEIERTYGVH